MKGLFGTNAASDPEVYKLPENTQQLMETHSNSSTLGQIELDDEKADFDAQGFKSIHDSLFDRAYKKLAMSLQMVPVADPAIGSLERG